MYIITHIPTFLDPLLLCSVCGRMVVKGAQALEVWARRVTEGYAHVTIANMTTRDGNL